MLIDKIDSKPDAGIPIPAEIDKRWGRELIFINGDYSSTDNKNSYCMKRIDIRHGMSTSMHFHVNKHETLYVASGTLTIKFNDGYGNTNREIVITEGNAFSIPPGFQHQLCATESDVVIIEASTPDTVQDSIRVSM